MKQNWLFLLVMMINIMAVAQDRRYMNLAILSTQPDLPFGKFSGLFGKPFHPGIEAGYGKIIKPRGNHEWFLELKFGYFFHRFVQHGLPVYLQFGYRYKINKNFVAETSVGAGYLHSIPATGKYKLDDNGEYQPNKGLGRVQVMGTYSIGLGYTMNPAASKPLRMFTTYQQRIQMPFIKSYVPLLPYNTLMIGVQRPLHKK